MAFKFLFSRTLCSRMRNASICVVNLRGIATELIKNIVLAGIGKLIVLDSEDVQEEDLGAGFFFREDDVGKKVRLLRTNDLIPYVITFSLWMKACPCSETQDRVIESSCDYRDPMEL